MKLSIITINYNNAAGLRRTLDSVAEQIWTDFEHIIIDGGSTDDSVDTIRTYADMYADKYPIKWVSEPDKGIYDAMNKGIRLATGEYCLFMNGGDCLCNVLVLEELFRNKFDTDIVSSNVYFVNGKEKTLFCSPEKVSLLYFVRYNLPHQGTIYKTSIFERFGMYDESYKIIGDYLFNMNALLNHQSSYTHIELVLALCDMDGITNNPKYTNAIMDETQRGLSEIFPLYADCFPIIRGYFQEKNDQQLQYFKEFKKTFLFKLIWKIRKKNNFFKKYKNEKFS